ncbi:MAG: hypothetical protein QW165_03880 [Candidatus Woesearchaeota archaeon]
MVQQSLIEYIQKLLQMGYDIGTIRTTLLNAGYSPYDVDSALRIAGAPGARKISTKLLVVVFIALLLISGVVLLVLKLTRAPPAELSISVDLFSTQVVPGGNVVANVIILNPSGTRTAGLIDFEVSGPGGVIARKTESFIVAAQASIPVSLGMPTNAPHGTYSLVAKMTYLNRPPVQVARQFDVVARVDEMAPGEIIEEKQEERAREAQLTCPGGCDDLNFCTVDSCVQGTCVHTPVTPCCGNRMCEPGESMSSCLLDCSERPMSVDEVRKKASDAAAADVGRASEICGTLVQRALVDTCLIDVSESAQSKVPCASIVDAEKRDACLITFAYQGDSSVCKDITNKYMKNSCLSLAGIGTVPS